MSVDTNTAQQGTEEKNEQKTEVKEFQPITSQEDLNKIVQSRIARERSKFEDYDDLKAKAEKLAEIEEANKTEAEKQAERFAEMERENSELKRKNALAEAANTAGVPVAILAGPGEDPEAYARALLDWKGAQEPAGSTPGSDNPAPKGDPVPSVGGNGPKDRGNISIHDQIAAAHENGEFDLERTLKATLLGN